VDSDTFVVFILHIPVMVTVDSSLVKVCRIHVTYIPF